MKNNTRKRKYKIINKFKFIRFILSVILLILFSYILYQFVTIHKLETQIKFNEYKLSNMTYELKDIEKDVKSSINNTVTYVNDVAEVELQSSVTIISDSINYDKKPKLLSKEYYEYILEISKIEEVPVAVILAILTNENDTYNPNLTYENVDGSIDIGLCQINSKYVEYYANQYNITSLNPYNPKQSIMFLARHIKYLSNYAKERYNLSEKDSYIFAAGAYNRGLGNECKYRNMYSYKEKFILNYEKFI